MSVTVSRVKAPMTSRLQLNVQDGNVPQLNSDYSSPKPPFCRILCEVNLHHAYLRVELATLR